MNRILYLEDKILALFTQMSFDLTPSKKGPLYEHFMMINPEHSMEPNSKVKLIASDAHNSGTILFESDAGTYDKTEYALILITRYLKYYDGSLHLSFKMENDWGSFGVFVR